MNQQISSRSFAGRLIAILAVVSLLAGAVTLSHEKKAVADATTAIDSTIHSEGKDSVYAVINENYLSIKYIFENSCFDCHSSKVNYPWYYKIPGIKGMIDDDIAEATDHFDMSEDFPFVSEHSQLDLLKDIKEEIENGDMPIMSYRMMHWGKMIEGTKRDSVFEWVDTSIELLRSFENNR